MGLVTVEIAGPCTNFPAHLAMGQELLVGFVYHRANAVAGEQQRRTNVVTYGGHRRRMHGRTDLGFPRVLGDFGGDFFPDEA